MSRRLYELLLYVYPADIRERDGREMTRQFLDELGAARGVAARAGVRLRGALDVLWHGTLARCAVRWSVSAVSAPVAPARDGARIWPAGLGRDFRVAVRRLANAPGFTALAGLTLALGIAATAAIGSLVQGVLRQPLPYDDAARLVSLHHLWEGRATTMSPPNFLDLQARARTLTAAGAYDDGRRVLTGRGDPLPVAVAEVSRGFFETLGTPPAIGRTFRTDEHDESRTAVVVMSHGFWRDRFGADPATVGATLMLDGVATEVVGIMPPEFDWPLGIDLWAPVEYDASYRSQNRGAWYLSAIGRLAPGVTLDEARAELAAIAAQLEQEHPDDNTRVGLVAEPLLQTLVGDARRGLLVLLAAVGFVLLIACVNVANLLLARATARRDEMALQVALGASRARIIRQVLVEGLVLAAIGGAVGLTLAVWGTRWLARLPLDIPRLADIGLDPRVAAVAAAVTLATGVLFSLVPALVASSASAPGAFRVRGGTSADGHRGARARGALVVAEVALAVVLLAGAGLLGRSFLNLTRVDPGFEVADGLTFRLGLPAARYEDDARRLIFYEALHEALQSVPGITASAAVLAVPPAGQRLSLSFNVEGRPPDPPGTDPTLEVTVADARYFGVMGIPVTRGRGLEASDRAGAPPVVVLTESAVRQYFPGEDPIGQRLSLGWGRNGGVVGGEVVGVVANVRGIALDAAPPPQVYVPLAQVPIGGMAFVVRSSLPPEAVAAGIRRAVSGLDPDLPVTGLTTLEAHVGGTITDRRLLMALFSAFAASALALAVIGVFGVLSYQVSQRTREIGVRMALGATPSRVVALVVRHALLLCATGAVLGMTGAWLLSGTLEALLFELSPTDPATYAVVAATLLAVAALAAWLPARRADRVDPLAAVRAE